jgi:CheY-like chemotaxis protein
MTGDRERCLQAGMNGYLSKPVAPGRIIEEIREHLHRNRRPDAPVANAALTTGAQPAPIDRLLAARLLDGDANLVAGMVLLFLQLAPERMQRLHAAAVRLDAVALQSQAHKLEKAAFRIAATEVARRSRELAEIAHTTNYGEIHERIALLGYEIQRLEIEVQARGPVREDLPSLEVAV